MLMALPEILLLPTVIFKVFQLEGKETEGGCGGGCYGWSSKFLLKMQTSMGDSTPFGPF